MTPPEAAGGEPESRTQTPHHSRRQEVRIGLVLYGGVSLAVYINGAARELFDMVRGRGIWGVIKELSDSDIMVDIVSGASAGGINGLYLSYALCAERELEPLARLWREKASFQSLLQKANDGDARSLLDSAYMERELANAFRTMERAPCNTDQELDGNRAPEELDCFLAVTNYDGHVETIGDLRQRPLRVTSHASRLHTRHRRGRREPFGGGQVAEKIPTEVLARFARATSAFPVAFEPVVLREVDAGSYGEEGLRDLDRGGLATMALHSVRVFTNMCRRLLPERGIWDRLNRGALRTGSAALTTLHLLLALALWRRRTRHQRRRRAFDREAIALERKIEALEQRK